MLSRSLGDGGEGFWEQVPSSRGLGAELPEDFGCLGRYLSVFFQMEAHTDVIAG